MEINITEFFNSIEPHYYSASRAELGDNAGAITWNNALDRAEDADLLDNEEKVDAFKQFVSESGGWTWDEINALSHTELNALFIQWISGDMREGGLHSGMTEDEWREYESLTKEGQCSGNIYGGPLSVDGQIYFCLG